MNPSHNAIEVLLTKRLKGMAILFFLLCSVTLFFAFFTPILPTLPKDSFILDENSVLSDIERLAGRTLFTDMQPLEPAASEILNFYYIATLFGSIGVMLLVRSRKMDETTEENPPC